MRISDADRDRAASVLSNALAEGRLTPEEHGQRLDAVFAAKTQADITPLISDLPGVSASGTALAGTADASLATAGGKPAKMISIVSGISRKGKWRVPQRIDAVSIVGSTDLDLREAILPPGEIRIRAICVLGGIDIVVPPEMHVVDDGWALLGGREIPPDTTESSNPNAPVLRVSGLSILGGMTVKRRQRQTDNPDA